MLFYTAQLALTCSLREEIFAHTKLSPGLTILGKLISLFLTHVSHLICLNSLNGETDLSRSCSLFFFFPHSLEARDSHVLNEITQNALACS